MIRRNQLLGALGLVAVCALLYGGWMAYQAHCNLVTLNVRNMEVRKVVNKLQWQTWETITLHSNVQGQVTLNVVRVPLEEVLKIVCDQTSCNWSTIYPLYSNQRSLVTLKKALRGELDPASNGWTNLQPRGFFGGGPMFGGGPPGGPGAPSSQLVSLQVYRKEVSFVALALNRFAGARVIPEDGTEALVNLTLDKASVPMAVAKLAKKAHRSWARLYVLRGQFGPGGPGRPGFAGGGPGGPGGPPPFGRRDGTNGPPQLGMRDPNSTNQFGPRGPGLPPEQLEDMRKQRETLEAQLMAALPTPERTKALEAEQQRAQTFQDMQNMTPEQRRERFGAMAGAGMDQRNRDRVRNSTPEQRVEQQRAMLQMRQRMQQMQAPPSP
jgi:hypothetical protein